MKGTPNDGFSRPAIVLCADARVCTKLFGIPEMLGLTEHYQPNLPDLLLPELIRPISGFSVYAILSPCLIRFLSQ